MRQLNARIRYLERAAKPAGCPTCRQPPAADRGEPDEWAGSPAEREEYARIMGAVVERARAGGTRASTACPDCARERPNLDHDGLLTFATDAELERMIEILDSVAGEPPDAAPTGQRAGTGEGGRPRRLSDLPAPAGPG